jgi:hypothetical protein
MGRFNDVACLTKHSKVHHFNSKQVPVNQSTFTVTVLFFYNSNVSAEVRILVTCNQ